MPGLSVPSAVRRLGVVSFLNDLASEMVYPLLPALVSTRLGGGAVALGVLDGVADAVSAGVKLLSGRLADRRRWRGPLVIGGYVLAALVRPLIGAATTTWQVIALRAGDRLGKGARTPARDALIADVAAPAIIGRAFGFHRAMDHAGAVVGPLLAWILLSTADMAPHQVILASLVPGALAVCVVVWAVQTVERREYDTGAMSQSNAVAGSPERAATRTVASTFFWLVVVFAFARFPETLFLLRLQEIGVPIASIPLVWAGLHVLRAGGGYWGGWLTDHLGARRALLLGWCTYAVVCAGLAFARSPVVAICVFLCFAVSSSFTEAPERAFVAGTAIEGRGSRFGHYHASVGLAGLLGGLVFGAVYAGIGGDAGLAASAGLTVVITIAGSLTRK